MRIKTVLFDVGGVVIVTPFERAAWLEQRRGLAPGTLGLGGPFAPGGDAHWLDVLNGDEGEDAYWQGQAERLRPLLDLASDDPVKALIAALFDGTEAELVRPGIGPALDALQGLGLRTGVLSNHLASFHHPEAISNVLARLDPVIDLSFSAVRKPDPRAFESAIEALGGPDPATVCHVDDLPVHIAGAASAGLRGFRFDPTDPHGSFTRLIEDVQR